MGAILRIRCALDNKYTFGPLEFKLFRITIADIVSKHR